MTDHKNSPSTGPKSPKDADRQNYDQQKPDQQVPEATNQPNPEATDQKDPSQQNREAGKEPNDELSPAMQSAIEEVRSRGIDRVEAARRYKVDLVRLALLTMDVVDRNPNRPLSLKQLRELTDWCIGIQDKTGNFPSEEEIRIEAQRRLGGNGAGIPELGAGWPGKFLKIYLKKKTVYKAKDDEEAIRYIYSKSLRKMETVGGK